MDQQIAKKFGITAQCTKNHRLGTACKQCRRHAETMAIAITAAEAWIDFAKAHQNTTLVYVSAAAMRAKTRTVSKNLESLVGSPKGNCLELAGFNFRFESVTAFQNLSNSYGYAATCDTLTSIEIPALGFEATFVHRDNNRLTGREFAITAPNRPHVARELEAATAYNAAIVASALGQKVLVSKLQEPAHLQAAADSVLEAQ
jgi:hypothetical protein